MARTPIDLPTPRGPVTEHLFQAWRSSRPVGAVQIDSSSPPSDEDLQLALWCCYHLHFGSFEGVAELEWDPSTLALRRELEGCFEGALREECSRAGLPTDPVAAIRLVGERSSPPLASTMAAQGTWEQLVEFVIHRSIYQLKEADAHTFGIPRLRGPGRDAFLRLQIDEYGSGLPGDAHAEIFARAMVALGLDDRLGGYVEAVPATTLATDNLVSMFGLHRRLRGALVGHLALFEHCSVEPMSRYVAACTRLGAPAPLRDFYEIHVEADVEHGRIALEDMVAAFAERGDDRWADEMVFGALALQRVEARFAGQVLSSWRSDGSSLRRPVAHRPAQRDLAPA